jgi:hypothetical protein
MSETKSLPEYSVKKSEDYPGWLIVTCPRTGCGEVFLVRAVTWRKPQKYISRTEKEYVVTGRSCPYCSKTAHMPKRISKSGG